MSQMTFPVHYPGRTIAISDMPLALIQIGDIANWGYTNMNLNTMRGHFQDLVTFAQQNGNLKLWCGEYGCCYTAPQVDKITWYQHLYSAFEEYGIARANWDYKANFGIVRDGVPQTEMIDAIFGK